MKRELESMPTILALAICVKQLGGAVIICQADIDAVAHSQLLEEFQGRNLILTHVAPPPQLPLPTERLAQPRAPSGIRWGDWVNLPEDTQRALVERYEPGLLPEIARLEAGKGL